MKSVRFFKQFEGLARMRSRYLSILALVFCQHVMAQSPAEVQDPPVHTPSVQTPSTRASNTASAMPGSGAKAQRKIGGVQVETILGDSGIEILLSDQDGGAVDGSQARGVAMLRIAGEPKRYRFDLLPADDGRLITSANLSRIAGKQVEVEILLASLPSVLFPRGTLKFREVMMAAPSATQLAAAAVARQKVCPVSGKPLGSMGEPVAVAVGRNTVYACCSSCVKSIESDPEKFVTGKPRVLVATATAADATAIAKQKVCPVMDEPLGGMGQPLKVTIGDKSIYLCCKGCVKRIEAEPAKYLEMVHGSGASAPKFDVSPLASRLPRNGGPAGSVTLGGKEVHPGVYQVSHRDQPFVLAQKRCPVMDEPLDAMGGPYKVNAAGRAIFICCPGCAKRIATDAQTYLSLLKKRGVDAPSIRN